LKFKENKRFIENMGIRTRNLENWAKTRIFRSFELWQQEV
jgi:hypothetical protein